jgi:hypothetical protein
MGSDQLLGALQCVVTLLLADDCSSSPSPRVSVLIPLLWLRHVALDTVVPTTTTVVPTLFQPT